MFYVALDKLWRWSGDWNLEFGLRFMLCMFDWELPWYRSLVVLPLQSNPPSTAPLPSSPKRNMNCRNRKSYSLMSTTTRTTSWQNPKPKRVLEPNPTGHPPISPWRSFSRCVFALVLLLLRRGVLLGESFTGVDFRGRGTVLCVQEQGFDFEILFRGEAFVGGECKALGVFKGGGSEAGAVVQRIAGWSGKEGDEDSEGTGVVLQQWGVASGVETQLWCL